jgi:hypothetical protein
VADGDEIAKDLAADVSPFIEYFLGGRPVRISDLAGTENTPASPASFDILDAFEQLGGFGARVTRVPAICGHQLLGVSGSSPIKMAGFVHRGGRCQVANRRTLMAKEQQLEVYMAGATPATSSHRERRHREPRGVGWH